MTRRAFLSLTAGSALATAAAGIGGYAYIYELEPDQITVEQVALALPRLPHAFEGLRLVQISDLHLGEHISAEHLHAVIDRVNAQNADVVAITGDYIHHNARPIADQIIPVLQRIQAREAVVGVMGNHDHWAGARVVREVVAAGNVLDLRNDVRTLRRGSDELHLCGLDDFTERISNLDQVLDRLPPTGGAVLLVHEPDYADISALTGRFDLQISGHSHGGQVRLPGIGPLVLPRYGQKYPNGHYTIGTMQLYTNRGIGLISPPVRFNCPPEITVFTLQRLYA